MEIRVTKQVDARITWGLATRREYCVVPPCQTSSGLVFLLGCKENPERVSSVLKKWEELLFSWLIGAKTRPRRPGLNQASIV